MRGKQKRPRLQIVRGVGSRGTTLIPPRVAQGRSTASNKALICNGITRPPLLRVTVRDGGSGPSIRAGPCAGSHLPPALCIGGFRAFFPSTPLVGSILMEGSGVVKGWRGRIFR